MRQWLIEPRDEGDLTRLAPVNRWSSLTVVERRNQTGTWSLTGSTDDLGNIRTAGRGVVISRDGVPVMSGPVTTIGPIGSKESTVSGLSDFCIFSDRTVYPVPTANWGAQTTSPYDVRTGVAETALLNYINANAGSTTFAGDATYSDRRTGLLVVPASLGRGGTVKHSGRFEKLDLLVADLAEAGGLHVDVIHDETSGRRRLVTVRETVDRRDEIRFGTPDVLANGLINDDWNYTIEAPTITDALVAGGGTGTSRSNAYARDTPAISAWKRVIEKFIDQRQTTDATELANSATDALADNTAPVQVSMTLTALDPDITLDMGDVVSVNMRGVDLSNPLRERTITVTVGNGQSEQVQIVAGSRDSSAWVTTSQKKLLSADRRIAKLEAQ